jgi:hypothetical protein
MTMKLLVIAFILEWRTPACVAPRFADHSPRFWTWFIRNPPPSSNE